MEQQQTLLSRRRGVVPDLVYSGFIDSVWQPRPMASLERWGKADGFCLLQCSLEEHIVSTLRSLVCWRVSQLLLLRFCTDGCAGQMAWDNAIACL